MSRIRHRGESIRPGRANAAEIGGSVWWAPRRRGFHRTSLGERRLATDRASVAAPRHVRSAVAQLGKVRRRGQRQRANVLPAPRELIRESRQWRGTEEVEGAVRVRRRRSGLFTRNP
jgi:hypothetical protein